MTEEERRAAEEAFFAKKRRQNAGEEAASEAATVRHADGTEERIEMGSVAGAAATGALEGAAEGAAKGAARAVKAGVGALVVDPAIGVAKLAGTAARAMGWDGLHKLAETAEQGWANWGADALDHGYEDWGTQLGDIGAKVTEIAGMAASFMGPGALAKAGGAVGKAAKAYNAALPFIFGNAAAVRAYDTATANGQSQARALTEAAANGAIHFLGFKAFQNKTIDKWLKIPEMREDMLPKFLQKGAEAGVKGFEGLVKAVRDGQLRETLARRGAGALKAGGILGAQNFFSSFAEQAAREDVRPVEELSDEELAAAKAKIDAWEAEQAKAAEEGRDPDESLKPEWEMDAGDRLVMALKAGAAGFGEGVFMEGVQGAGEAALTLREAREVTAGAIRSMIATPQGRAFLARQDADALDAVAEIARKGGKASAEQLDAAGLPPDMEMRDVRRLAFDLKRDVEEADRRAAMESEEYRKRAELAERLVEEQKDGETLEFDSEEQKAEAELALQERAERRQEATADAATEAAQGMADTLFGKDAGVLVRRGTQAEAEAAAKGALGAGADAQALKNAAGEVFGYWDRGRNEMVLFRNADHNTVAHELGWHATRQWAERNAPGLLKRMNEYAARCPEEIRKEIEAAYPDFSGDALLDEIGAGRFEREMGERFRALMERSPEAKSWWQGLKEMIAEAWRGMVRSLKVGKFESLKVEEGGIDLKALEGMTPEEGMAWLADRMIEGKALRGAEGGEADASRGGAEARRGTPPPLADARSVGEEGVRYSRRMAAVEDGEVEKSLDAIIAGKVKRSGGKAIRLKEQKGEEGKVRQEAQKVFRVLKDERIPLPNGGELYFAPDERTVAAYGGSVQDAWAEYCIHLVTHGVTKAETGERYRTFSEANVEKVLPEIRETVAANQVKIAESRNRVLFYRQTIDGPSNNKSRYQKIVADIDENGDARIDLRYITGMHKSGRIPGQLTTLEDALQAGYAKSDATAARSAFDGADYSTGGEAAQGGAQIRPSIGGIYTGTAADYANRSRQGGVDDGPSVKKIGTGEGSQVYGWGLYGSTVRGVAEGYAEADKAKRDANLRIGRQSMPPRRVLFDGKPIDFDRYGKNEERSPEAYAAKCIYQSDGDMAKAEEVLSKAEGYVAKAALEWLRNNKERITPPDPTPKAQEQVYEQTFFTNRAAGDESHLLKWYEPVSEEQLGWIEKGLQTSDFGLPGGAAAKLKSEVLSQKSSLSGGELYQAVSEMLGSEEAASEFLYRAGIDGVKYPVDSYGGKTLKDGDKAGWNYVAFSDEHIRVDHKWTDGQIRYSRRMSLEEDRERTARALEAVRAGRVRVADTGGTPGEASEAGQAAGEELAAANGGRGASEAGQAAPSDMPEIGGARAVALSTSQLLGLFRALRGNPNLVRVLKDAKRRGAAWVSRLTKGSDVELNPEAFGIVDASDRERIKAELVAEGNFRHEDPVWNMKHSKKQCDFERETSEMKLEDRLHTLAEDRVRGKAPGGNRVVTNALAHEIGQLLMEMPASERLRTAAGKEGAAAFKDLRTVGEGLVKALRVEWLKGEKVKSNNPTIKQSNNRTIEEWDENLPMGAELREAVETVAWWRGATKDAAEYERIGREQGEAGLKAVEAEENRAKAALARDHEGLARELFGMFLAAPETLRERAPRAFGRVVEAMGANDALLDAYSRIASADAPTEVMAKIEAQYTAEAMQGVRKALADLKKPLATWWQDKRLRVMQGVWSKESPALMRIKWAAKERIGLAKKALEAAKKGGDKAEIARAERDLETAKRTSREEIANFGHEIIAKHRDGGAGRIYLNEMYSRVLGALDRGGLEVKDLDRYLKCRNVIANQGKAMDFGITPQEAHRALEAQRRDLGEGKWAALEEAAKEFHANRERNILEDANVREMIGERRLANWKLNSSYIRTERTLSVEEVAELNAAQYEPLSPKTVAKFKKRSETKGWELLTEPANVARMKPVELDIDSPVKRSASGAEGGNNTIRKAIEKIFASFGKCRNAESNEEVEFPGSSAGKMMFQSGADMEALAPHLKALFEGATAAWYEPEARMEGHTFHPDVKGYRNYINRFATKDGTEWYIRFTVRENKGAAGRNDVHAATVSDVRLYKNTGATIPVNKTSRSSGAGSTIPADNTGRRSGAFVDRKISHFLSGVKTDRAVDVVKEMDALIKLHQTKGVMGGDRYLQPLVGSFRATEAPTEATAMHDMSLLEYARQNHYVAALAETAERLGMKGFKVVRDMRYRGVDAGERYGTRAFMKDGENYLLIMPKDVERGFRSDAESMQFLVELNRGMAKALTTFSARFAVRNVARNREANENNIEWMAPSLLKKVMGDAGFRPEARKLEMLIERAVVRLPDWVVRNPVVSLIWNPKTNMHWIGEATRLAKLIMVPGELRRVSEEADRLVKEAVEGGGDVEKAVAAAKRLLADCEKAKRIAKMPIFAGNYLKQLGYGGRDDAAGLFDRLEGRRAETDADRLPYLGKVWQGMKWWMEKVGDFNTLEETRTKIAALLSAEWQRAAAKAKGKTWKFDDGRRIDDIIAVNSGSPMGELRGTWWNAMETMVTGLFGNVSMKGAVRTIESAKRSPLEWTLKAVRRAENYAARRILWQGGGMLLLIGAARRWFADDEEAQRSLDVLEGWAKKMTKAFAMITDYRLKTYDIMPLAILGNDAVLGVNIPRGDEDKLITPLVDYAVDAALGSDAAQAAGFVEPLGGRYDLGGLVGATLQNSGLIPDITRGGLSFKVIEDTFGAMLFSNPYNAFTGRPTYDEGLYKNRGERKGEFLKEMLKQAWNDLGGQSVLPLAQGPEDAKDVPNGMTGVWSATGVETQVPGGKTVFQMLHTVPVASAVLSGFAFINMNGQDRIDKRLLAMEAERKAVLDHVAMQCLDLMARRHDDCADYMPIIQAAMEKHHLDGEDVYAIQQAIVRKKVKAAKMMGQENVPILEQMRRMKPGEYERRRRHLVGIGWEVE